MLKQKIRWVLSILEEKRLSTVTGAWVYYFLISAVPLAFLFITAFGVLGVDIAQNLVSSLPVEFRSAGQAIVNAAKNGGEGATVFFIGTVLFSSATLLNQMSKDGDYIYGAKSKIKRGIFRRAWAILAIGALFVIFLALGIIFAFSGAINLTLLTVGKKGILLTILAFAFIIVFSYIIILVLNKFICPHRLSFSQTAIGALVSLFVMVLGTIAFIIYVKFFSRYNAFYGSLASIIVFLLWTYILMLGLVLGVIANSLIVKKTGGVLYVKNSKFNKALR